MKNQNIYIDCIGEGLVEVNPSEIVYLSKGKEKTLKLYSLAKSVFGLPYDAEEKGNFIRLYFSTETVDSIKAKIDDLN